MKKVYILLLFLFFHGYFCNAQSPDSDDQKVEVVKMAYMTRELNLTPQEAQNFWPVYNNYNNELRQARQQYPNDEVGFEKKVVEIKQRYQGNFKKVLGNNGQRLNKVYTTDKNFRDMLRNEYQQRQMKKQQNQVQQQPPVKNNEQNNLNQNNRLKRGGGGLKRRNQR